MFPLRGMSAWNTPVNLSVHLQINQKLNFRLLLLQSDQDTLATTCRTTDSVKVRMKLTVVTRLWFEKEKLQVASMFEL